MLKKSVATIAAASLTLLVGLAQMPVQAQDNRNLNLYSARHYSTDEALYADFTKATGIKVNRVDADDAGILNRLKAEGTSSPADVILLVDAARLWKGEIDGLFAPVKYHGNGNRQSSQRKGLRHTSPKNEACAGTGQRRQQQGCQRVV